MQINHMLAWTVDSQALPSELRTAQMFQRMMVETVPRNLMQGLVSGCVPE